MPVFYTSHSIQLKKENKNFGALNGFKIGIITWQATEWEKMSKWDWKYDGNRSVLDNFMVCDASLAQKKN